MRDWAQAEDAYRLALESNGVAPAIWVQYGHALKEQGKLVQALDAYRTALRLDGTNADTHLQLGHALKLSGDRSAAAEAYWQALKIDPSLNYAAMELQALGWREDDLPRNGNAQSSLHTFREENEFALLLAAVRASKAGQYPLLISNPVFALSNKAGGGSTSPPASTPDQATIPPGPLEFETRADCAAYNQLDPDYADEDVPLTCHMTHTWYRFDNMRHQFHLNSDRNRMAFIIAYYRNLRWSIGSPPEKLVSALNVPAHAHGPLTRFLFAVWQADYRDRSDFNIQQEEGYINFLVEVVSRRSWAKHLPDELVPRFVLSALHRPAIHGSPHALSKGQYSTWTRSDLYRMKYPILEDLKVRQAFSFDLIINELGNDARSQLISPDAINFWSGPISPEVPGLSRFAAVLAHVSRRFGDNIARSPAAIRHGAETIARWFGEEVIPRFPQFATFAITHSRFRDARPKALQSRFGLRSELQRLGVDHLPGDRGEEIDLLVIGPIAAQSGLGTGVRRTIDALNRTGCTFRTLHFAYDNPSVMVAEQDKTAYHGENPRAVLWHYNAEYLQDCMNILNVFTRGRYNIGYFFWETEIMPKVHRLTVDMVDEIWAPSEFVAKCYSGAEVPVTNVGTCVEFRNTGSFLGRSYFGFGDEFVFMFSFDGHSVIHRKNPGAVVRAFLKAFGDKTERVRLIVKSQNLWADWGQVNGRHEELFELCAKDGRIEIIDQTMPLSEYHSLKEACDCYVSLHRSEGFGYGPAEAMALGKPVIMTNYSANTEFATPDNCLLVDAKLVHMRDGEYLYWLPEMVWAEADIDQAAAHMRRVFEDRAFAAQLGERAKESITRDFGPDAMARRYAKRLTELGLNGNLSEGRGVLRPVSR